MQNSLLMVGVLVALLAAAVTTAAAQAPPPPRCLNQKCGNLSVPYPFGMDSDCYREKKFFISCSDSTNPPTAYLGNGNLPVTNISLEEGELQIQMIIARNCYDKRAVRPDKIDDSWIRTPDFTISATKNKFMAVGCDTEALFGGYRGGERYMSGCTSFCQSSRSISESCSGIGCCQTSIPSGLKNQNITLGSYYNHNYSRNFNPCSYAFVVEDGKFNFSGEKSFLELNNTERLPMILNWEIGIESCSAAQKRGNYPCHNKTTKCIDRSKTSASSGYFCQCLDGYQGNPYHLDGCQDIDECASNPCKNGKCTNLPGNYSCSCNRGYKNQDVITCIKDTSATSLKISLGVSLSFSVLVVAILGIYRERRKSRLKKLKDKYFDANGGVLLQEKMASLGNTARLFTENDIKATTNNYDKGKKVGEGSYGIVYKGILEKQVVAIKKSRVSAPIDPNQNTDPVDQEQITARNQFRNEINALYQINHTNVVRLIGCCLETPTPILVYEFMCNGTLYENIHRQEGKKPSPPLKLAQRLKIAAETADALAYLHHSTFKHFIHRGVKTANILLDKNLTAKLSGFGASTLVLGDENETSTLAYEKEKSNDVYSFALVLVELLTSLKAEEKEVKLFVRSVEGRTLRQTLDEEIWEDRFDKEITKVAELTKKCLNAKAEERPSMKDVASDLQELLRTMPQHPSGGVEDDISPSPKDTGN